MEEKVNIVFTSQSLIYNGEVYPVLYFPKENPGIDKNGFLVMASSEKGLPCEFIKKFKYNKSYSSVHFQSNIAYISTANLSLYRALEYAYAERCLFESNRRRLIIDCTPFELYKYWQITGILYLKKL